MMNKLPDTEVITPDSDMYPRGMISYFGALLPPNLWCMGNIELLRKAGVGFCGSRKASEKSLDVAADCAEQLSEQHYLVNSGYAPGVDMAAHYSALRSGGETIIVLPSGIDHFRVKKSIADVWSWDRVLVVSQFERSAIWRVDRAMERNNVIIALSGAVIALEARGTGGTLAAGFSALKANKPLFVVEYSEKNSSREGNEILLNNGGRPLRQSKTTGRANLSEIFDILQDNTGDYLKVSSL